MTDIFVRTRTRNSIRLALAKACLARLARLRNARVQIIAAHGFVLPEIVTPAIVHWANGDEFHIDSRLIAQTNATGDVYVVIDDDCMPIGQGWLEQGLAVMSMHPQFAALASLSINGEILPEQCAVPPDGTYDAGEIFEVPSLGTPTFIRRRRGTGEEIDLDIRAGDLGQYDGTLSEAYKAHGRIGMLRWVRHNHLGYGLSEVVPEWWLA